MNTSFPYKLAEEFIKFTKLKKHISELNIKEMRKQDSSKPLPFPYFSVKYRQLIIKGTPCYMFTPPKLKSDEIIVFMHGGAFVFGPQIFHWIFVKKLALETGRKVLFINYPKAPENPYPAAVNSCMDIVSTLSNPFILMGDSAGGNLAIVLALKLRDENKTMPQKIVALSPVVDCTLSNPSISEVEDKDVMLERNSLIYIGENWYAKSKKLLVDASVSPLYAKTLKGLPPLFIQIGTHDILYPDTVLFYEKAKKEGVEVSMDLQEGMLHDWMIAPEIIPESKVAAKKIFKFIKG